MPSPFKFDNTMGVINKIGSDLNKAIRIYEVLIQLIFLGYYSYNVWKNENLALFIINIVLLSLFALYFVLYIITFFKKGVYERLIRKKVRRYLVDFKMVTRLFTIGLSIFMIVNYGAADIDKIFLIVSVIGLILQVLLRIIQLAFDKYSKMFVVAVQMDVEEFNSTALGRAINGAAEITSSPRRTFFKVINKGLEKIDNVLHGPEVTLVEEGKDKDQVLKTKIDELGTSEKEKNEAKSKIKKEAKAKRLQEEKEKSRNLMARIFPKKNQKATVETTNAPKQIEPPKE